MTVYYTGTTIECLKKIMEAGKISTEPPERVWEDYSEDYVYLLPADEELEDGESFHYCVEQSDFAVAVLNGTQRVILHIEGIDEDELSEDKDGPHGSVKYPYDIPIECIKKVYIEDFSSVDVGKVKELVAITHLILNEEWSVNKIANEYEDCGYDEDELFEEIDILNIELVNMRYLLDEDELSCRHLDLLEEVDREINLISYEFDELKTAL